MSGEETVQIPASLLEKMQAQIAALSEKVGLKEDEIINPDWPVTVYRQDPQADVEEHDHVNFKASFQAKAVHDEDALAAALKDGWTKDVPDCWLASYVPPKPPKSKSKA
jgi:hypothetical protein